MPSEQDEHEIDRETTGMLLGLGTGIMIGTSIPSIHTVLAGSFCILSGLGYEIYQRVKIREDNAD